MQQLLKLGRQDGGIDADDFEAAVEIVDARSALTRGLGFAACNDFDRPSARNERVVERGLGPRDLRLVQIYLAWGNALYDAKIGVRTTHIAAWIESTEIPPDVPALVRSLGLWSKTATDYDRATGRKPEPVVPVPFSSSPTAISGPLSNAGFLGHHPTRQAPDPISRANLPTQRRS